MKITKKEADKFYLQSDQLKKEALTQLYDSAKSSVKQAENLSYANAHLLILDSIKKLEELLQKQFPEAKYKDVAEVYIHSAYFEFQSRKVKEQLQKLL